jgi:hypothetical protein
MKSSHAGKIREYQNDQTSHKGPVSAYTQDYTSDSLILKRGRGNYFPLDNCQPYQIPAFAGMTNFRP